MMYVGFHGTSAFKERKKSLDFERFVTSSVLGDGMHFIIENQKYIAQDVALKYPFSFEFGEGEKKVINATINKNGNATVFDLDKPEVLSVFNNVKTNICERCSKLKIFDIVMLDKLVINNLRKTAPLAMVKKTLPLSKVVTLHVINDFEVECINVFDFSIIN